MKKKNDYTSQFIDFTKKKWKRNLKLLDNKMTYTHINFTVEITINILTDTEFKKKLMLATHSGTENNKSPYQNNL